MPLTSNTRTPERVDFSIRGQKDLNETPCNKKSEYMTRSCFQFPYDSIAALRQYGTINGTIQSFAKGMGVHLYN
jgi:hypothetical protein